MTVINHKSISGVTSITAPAGSDNLFTVHTNDTTERFRIDASGHQNISGIITAANFKTGTSNLHNTGLNIQDLDVDGHTNLDNVSIAGVTTFSGALDINAGVNISGLGDFAASSFNNIRLAYSGDNEIDTSSGNLILDSAGGTVEVTDNLTVSGNIRGTNLKANAAIYADASANTALYLHSTGTTGQSRIFLGDASTFQAGKIVYDHTNDYMMFGTGGAGAEKLRITSTGNIGINSTSPNAQFVINRSLSDNQNQAIEMGYSASSGGLHFIQAYNRSTSAFTLLKLNNAVSITSTGRVGIGTEDPQGILDITGNRQGTSIDMDGAFKQDGSMNWNFAQHQWIRSASNTNATKIVSILAAGDNAADTNLYNNINFLARTSSNFGAASTSRGIGVSLEITSPNEIKFGTNTAERFSIESDGDIRIGSDSQYAWIRGWQSHTDYGGGSMFISADHSASGSDQGASGKSNMIFRCRGSEKMRITGIGGSVGIGTEYPDTLLHLYGSSGTQKLITLAGGDNKRNNYIGINGSDNLIIGADHDEEGGSSSVRIHVDGSEIIRVLKTQVDIGYGSAVNIAKFCQSDNNHQIVGQASNNVAALDVYSQHGDDVNRISFAVSDNRTGSKSNSFVVNGQGKVGINTDAMSAHPGNSMTQGDMLHIVPKTGNTAMINLNGSIIGGGITPTTVAHDTYFEIDTPFYGGCVVLTAYSTWETYPQPVASGLIYFDVGPSLHLHKLENGHPSLVVSNSTSTTAGDHTDNKIVVTPVGTSTKKLRVWWRVTSPSNGYIRWTFL